MEEAERRATLASMVGHSAEGLRISAGADSAETVAAAEMSHREFYELGRYHRTWRDTRWFG